MNFKDYAKIFRIVKIYDSNGKFLKLDYKCYRRLVLINRLNKKRFHGEDSSKAIECF